MSAEQIVFGEKNQDGSVVFFGRLYRTALYPRSDNHGWTKEEASALKLKGKPILVEHEGDPVGEITDHWVDIDNWLVIKGELYGKDRIGQRHEQVRQQLKNKELKDLSISWKGLKRDNYIAPDTKCFVEATLTREGAFDGTQLLSVRASANNNPDGDTFTATAEIMEQASEQDLREMVADAKREYGVEMDPSEIRGLNSDQIMHYMLAKLEATKNNAMKQLQAEKAQMEQNSRMTEEQLKRLQEFEEREEKERERYREREVNLVDDIYNAVADSLPEEQRKIAKQAITEMAGNPDLSLVWNFVKTQNEQATTWKSRFDEQTKDLTKTKSAAKRYEKQLTQPQEVAVEASRSKTGVRKNERDTSPVRSRTEEVSEMASRQKQLTTNMFGAVEPKPRDEIEGAYLSVLAEFQKGKLDAGCPTWHSDAYLSRRYY